jgi:ectoine hydroxylase-related dioxygenase (phytanoyl-CoA dioxygenase family)
MIALLWIYLHQNEFEKNILIPELNLGDAVLFNFKTVHGSTGNNTSKSRRAFSMRFIGDDIIYIDRGGPTSPPFDGINLKTGDRNERRLVS